RPEAALCHSGLAPKRQIASPALRPSARAPVLLCTLLFIPFCRSCLHESPALGVGLPPAQHVPDDRGQLAHHRDAGDGGPPAPLDPLEPLAQAGVPAPHLVRPLRHPPPPHPP